MTDTETLRALRRRAAAVRRHVVTVASTQFAHLGGSMSCADILVALYFHWLRVGTTSRSATTSCSARDTRCTRCTAAWPSSARSTPKR